MFRSIRFLLASLISLLASMILSGCSKDADLVDLVVVYNVPAEYQPFVDTFIYEASIRGYSIEIENLIINYDESLEAPHCAKCNSNDIEKNTQKIVSINPNISCVFTSEQREVLVFHELGHCVLGRLHDNGRLPNGDFKSLMNENDLSVYSSCVYPVDNGPCDHRFKRSYYLDELFDKDTPVPDWGN
jgi:hypothetical protein